MFGGDGCMRVGGVWGDGCMRVGGVWGVPPTHMHTHACTRMCGKHDNFMQMVAPFGGIPGNSL